MRLQVVAFAGWILVLLGVASPWTQTRIERGNRATLPAGDGATLQITKGSDAPVTEVVATYGFDTYQGWLFLWLPLVAMAAAGVAMKSGRSVAMPQMGVGLIVCALSVHLLLRPQMAGDASRLVHSGGIVGFLGSMLSISLETRRLYGLWLVLAGGLIYSLAALGGVWRQVRPGAPGTASPTGWAAAVEADGPGSVQVGERIETLRADL